MNAAARSTPDDAQRRIVAELARITAMLERHAARLSGMVDHDPASALATGTGVVDESSPLARVSGVFGLSPFERDVLLLCAGMELDSTCAGLVARLQDGGAPSFALALAALDNAHWTALLPDAPLRAWRLIELEPGPSLVSRALRIDERILHGLLGLDCAEPGLIGLLRPGADAFTLPEPQQAIALRVARALDHAWTAALSPAPIQLTGDDAALRQAVAGAAVAQLGQDLLVLDSTALGDSVTAPANTYRLCEREALLAGACLLLTVDGDPDPAQARALRRLLDSALIPVLISVGRALPPTSRGIVTVDIPRVTTVQQRTLWQHLTGAGARADGLDAIAWQFDLGLTAMAAAVRAAKTAHAGDGEAAPLPAALWQACREQARCGVGRIAERIEPRADWSSLILPEREMALLRALADQVRYRAVVHGDWGFGQHSDQGLGIAALFAGTSGTGKTLAAQVLANALQLDLYRIDLSAVVDKYIGETEKNLARVFDAAEAGGAILLFDEADALFGKRSEVKDSHDRHANIEVSYLLQRVEAYRGLAILTTNMKNAIDPAFLRRLRYVVDFPFPDAVQRAAIWRSALPAAMPQRGIDPARLAQLNIAGGTIRSIALNAAFLAAGAGVPLGMAQIEAATRSEYAKLERSLSASETQGWG